ncbi:MAG TPA: GNAT family N-acetyltransferase [Ktedonobacterales bacterium]|jgi:ribosomal protein S18 acetylase RimI-like enzyme
MSDERHDAIILPGAPAIPSLIFRHARIPDDLPGLVAVHEGSAQADGVDPLSSMESIPTLDELHARFAPSSTFDPTADALVVELDGQAIGYSRVTWWTERDGVWLYLTTGRLLPAWRRRGVGTAMLRWAESCAAASAATHSTDGKAMLGANASSTEVDATALLLDAGYHETFSMVEMRFDAFDTLPPVELPTGLAFRPVTPDQYRAIWESVQAAYADSPQNVIATEEDYQEWLVSSAFDPTLWRVAWEGEQIAGQALCEIAKGRGEVAEVSVGAPWRQHGLGYALVVAGLSALAECGVSEARLHARADNIYGAPRLYERVGFHPLKRFARYRKPLQLS